MISYIIIVKNIIIKFYISVLFYFIYLFILYIVFLLPGHEPPSSVRLSTQTAGRPAFACRIHRQQPVPHATHQGRRHTECR